MLKNISKLFKKKNTHERKDMVVGENTAFSIREAYKTIRTNIMFSLSDKEDCRTVIFTSAIQGEGKTSTAVNMAITFAQTDAKVLLMDCDLRRARVHRMLSLKNEAGISDVLAGMDTAENVLKQSPLAPGVDVLTAGHIPPNPSELLVSPRMGQLMQVLKQQYDYILIDTPPVTLVADSTSMRNYADGYVVVLRENYTPRKLLEDTEERLNMAEARILGYVISGVGAEGSYGGYQYKYSYRYGD